MEIVPPGAIGMKFQSFFCFFLFFLFSEKNKKTIIFWVDNFPGMLKPIILGKIRKQLKISCAEIFTQHAER